MGLEFTLSAIGFNLAITGFGIVLYLRHIVDLLDRINDRRDMEDLEALFKEAGMEEGDEQA